MSNIMTFFSTLWPKTTQPLSAWGWTTIRIRETGIGRELTDHSFFFFFFSQITLDGWHLMLIQVNKTKNSSRLNQDQKWSSLNPNPVICPRVRTGYRLSRWTERISNNNLTSLHFLSNKVLCDFPVIVRLITIMILWCRYYKHYQVKTGRGW